MSRTYKIHTHKAPRDRRLEASNRGMKSRYRSAVRAALRGVRDLSAADDFYCDPMISTRWESQVPVICGMAQWRQPYARSLSR